MHASPPFFVTSNAPDPVRAPCSLIPLQKRRLQHLTSREGKEDFHAWVTSAQLSIMEVFQEFPSVQVPFEHLVQLLPRLSPRSYTISSSSVVTPNTVHLSVSMLRTVRFSLCVCVWCVVRGVWCVV